MATVFDVANFFLYKSSMTQKKLQKLVYYGYAWTLTLLNDSVDDLANRLFDERIEAWIHGPVCPELYREYKRYGWEDIPVLTEYENPFSSDVNDVLEQVWDVYGGYTGNELETISHREVPWINARKGCPPSAACSNRIEDTDIYLYYNERCA